MLKSGGYNVVLTVRLKKAGRETFLALFSVPPESTSTTLRVALPLQPARMAKDKVPLRSRLGLAVLVLSISYASNMLVGSEHRKRTNLSISIWKVTVCQNSLPPDDMLVTNDSILQGLLGLHSSSLRTTLAYAGSSWNRGGRLTERMVTMIVLFIVLTPQRTFPLSVNEMTNSEVAVRPLIRALVTSCRLPLASTTGGSSSPDSAGA
mmetsp:Transcript_7358/g.16791  ORF Transcript_7358/g.16791 Transcript_7358/m.16791 type:complete len:207 (+) Transcript_7358:2663-3283(+)